MYAWQALHQPLTPLAVARPVILPTPLAVARPVQEHHAASFWRAVWVVGVPPFLVPARARVDSSE